MITIVGTGLKRGQLTLDALDAMESGRVFFHTGRCEAADVLAEKGIAFSTLDDLYDAADDFDEHAELVVERLLEEEKAGDLVYCVFDVRDETVRALAASGAELRVIPGPPVDGALFARIGGSAQVYSAGDVETAPVSPFLPAIVREIDSRELAGDVKLRLTEVYPAEWPVIVLRGDGEETVPLHRIDRLGRYDHTLSLLVPAVEDVLQLERFDLDSLMQIVRRLTDPDGCPWDREQTHESMLPNIIEEAYESVDAVERGDGDLMYDELGDLLYQIAMHAEIGRRHGEFGMADVTSAICEKLIRRHPFIFADSTADTVEETHEIWRKVKMQ